MSAYFLASPMCRPWDTIRAPNFYDIRGNDRKRVWWDSERKTGIVSTKQRSLIHSLIHTTNQFGTYPTLVDFGQRRGGGHDDRDGDTQLLTVIHERKRVWWVSDRQVYVSGIVGTKQRPIQSDAHLLTVIGDSEGMIPRRRRNDPTQWWTLVTY